MKLAFLFLTADNHHQPDVWRTFFDEAAPEHYAIYCHPKFPERLTQPFLRDNVVAERCATAYGDISLVRALLLLLKAAYRDVDNQYFALLSESCVPLYPFKALRERLMQRQASWICYGFDSRAENSRRWQKLSPPGLFRLDEFRKQHQWVVLNRRAVKLLLEHDLTPAFERVYAADEHYVINTLAHGGVDVASEVYNMAPTFVDWEDCEIEPEGTDDIRLRPKLYDRLSIEEVLYARCQGSLFMRKVLPGCDCRALRTADGPWGPPKLAPRAAAAPPTRSAGGPPATLPTHPSARPFWTVISRQPQAVPDDAEVVQAGDDEDWYAAINRGLQAARGEWIHILPAGHQPGPDFYLTMRSAIERLPSTFSVAFCRYRAVRGDGRTFEPALEGDLPALLEADWLDALAEQNPLHLSAVVLRRSVFEAIGGFCTDLPHCADWEFYLRAAISYRWWYQPERLVTCALGDPEAEVPAAALEQMRRSRRRAAIHLHRLDSQRRLPWGLRAASLNFMMVEEPE